MRLPSLSKSKSEVFGQSGHCSARLLQHVPTAMNRDSQDTPEVRV